MAVSVSHARSCTSMRWAPATCTAVRDPLPRGNADEPIAQKRAWGTCRAESASRTQLVGGSSALLSDPRSALSDFGVSLERRLSDF